MSLMTMSTAIMTVYTLQRLHNFTHRSMISSLAKRLKVSILPNIHFFWCTARRSPQSFIAFPNPQNIHTKVSPLWKSHPTEAPSCAKDMRNPLHHLSPGSRILSFYPEYPQNWENNMLLHKAYPYQSCDCALNMVTYIMNRSLGSLAVTTTIQNCT
jgi:hypothetical protein